MEKIRLVMDMVETPEKYSEFQVNSILQDEECRQIYLTMLEMRMAFDKKDLEENLDLDHEWQKIKSKSSAYEASLCSPQVGKNAQEMLDPNLDSTNSVGRFIPNTHKIKDVAFLKIVASFVGVLLLSGVAFAAIHTFFPHLDAASQNVVDTTKVHVGSFAEDTVPAHPSVPATAALQNKELHHVFDNVPLVDMLDTLAKYYGVRVEYHTQEAKQLRFYYEWNGSDELRRVLDELNHSQQVNLSLEGGVIVVE